MEDNIYVWPNTTVVFLIILAHFTVCFIFKIIVASGYVIRILRFNIFVKK